MTRPISFAWTTPALLAGAKSVTRRDWNLNYARQFGVGDIVTAYDQSPRVYGKPVATIRLTVAPYYESEAQMPDSDYEAEGFAWFDEHPDQIPKAMWGRLAPGWTLRALFDRSRKDGAWVWVVRFKLLEVLG